MAAVSVIIPARDAAATLDACLAGLAAEGVPGPDVELLVVDDRSCDATAEIAERHGARVLSGAGLGPGAARNLGARVAAGEILVFLDADTVPCPGWLRELLAPLADPRVQAVKGRYFSSQTRLLPRFAQLEFEEKYRRLERAASVDFVDTGTAAFRRDALLEAGGFDERFPAQSAEDVELAFRLASSGATFAFSSRAGVLHQHVESLSRYLYKKARYGYFRVRVYRRHPRKALGDSYTPPVMGLQIGLAGLAGALTLLRRPRLLAGVLGVFLLTTLPLARRAPDRDLAVAVPALVFLRAFAQGLGIVVGLGDQFLDRFRG